MPETFLVGWQCDKCGRRLSGFLPTGASAERPPCGYESAPGCRYPARVRKNGDVALYSCPGIMRVFHDERPPKLNVLVMERDPPLTERERAQEIGGSTAYRKQRSV